MATPNLGITHIASNQNQKEATANTAFDQLDLAMTQYILEDINDAHFTLPEEDAETNMVFIFAGVITGARGIVLPIRRLYIVSNQTFSSPAVPLLFGTASSPSGRVATVSQGAPGTFVVLYCDGVNVDIVASSAGGLILEHNGIQNTVQTVLNLIAGSNVTITDNGAGGLTISSSGSGGGGSTPTLTLKQGSGNGTDYNTSSTSYVNVDGTNLTYTVVIPTGSKLKVEASFDYYVSGGTPNLFIALADGATILDAREVNPPGTTSSYAGSLLALINGDGASHTITLQWKVSGNTGNIRNQAGSVTPKMAFTLTTSN